MNTDKITTFISRFVPISQRTCGCGNSAGSCCGGSSHNDTEKDNLLKVQGSCCRDKESHEEKVCTCGKR